MKWRRKKAIQPTGEQQPEQKADALKAEVPRAEKPKVLDLVKIVEEYPSLEYSSNAIWALFKDGGEIVKIGANKCYSEKISGSPEMTMAEDGSLVPHACVFEGKLNNISYIVSLEKGYSGGLKATVECGAAHAQKAQELLKKARQNLVLISREYQGLEPVRMLYSHLVKNSPSLKILAVGHASIPKMLVDEEQGLIPLEARIVSLLDGKQLSFIFSKMYNYKVDVECPTEMTGTIADLLDSMAIKPGEKDGVIIRGLDSAIPVKEYHWDMVGGLGKVKEELQQYIEWPLQNPELFKTLDTAMPKGVILIGPPGNGKTTIAKILANETKAVFYSVSPKDINTKWVGDTEKKWGQLFYQARQDVKKGHKVIIFIDEIDGFYTSREEMDKYSRISFGQFCQEMEGISDLENVIVLAATNRFEILDAALTRPGRFTKKIYLGNPDEQGRREVLQIYTGKKPIAPGVDLNYLVQKSDGYSGAQLKELCDAAAFSAIEHFAKTRGIKIYEIKGDLMQQISLEKCDFEKALEEQERVKLLSLKN